MQGDICMFRKRMARFLLEHEDNKFKGTFTSDLLKRKLENEDAIPNSPKRPKKTKKNQKEKATTSDEGKDGDEPDYSAKSCSKTYMRRKGCERCATALKATPGSTMQFKGDCSANPFNKPDTWEENLGDTERRVQLYNKIIDNEELKRYILCFALLVKLYTWAGQIYSPWLLGW